MLTVVCFYVCDIQKHWNSKATHSKVTWENDSVCLTAVPTDLNLFFLKCTCNRKPVPVCKSWMTGMA